jgi:hypothetical protein
VKDSEPEPRSEESQSEEPSLTQTNHHTRRSRNWVRQASEDEDILAVQERMIKTEEATLMMKYEPYIALKERSVRLPLLRQLLASGDCARPRAAA